MPAARACQVGAFSRRLSAMALRALLPALDAVAAQDRHAGCRFPQITGDVTCDRPSRSAEGAGKAMLMDFVSVRTSAQLEARDNPGLTRLCQG